MGLFSSILKSTPTVIEFKPQTIQEAYISILYPLAKADGDFGDEEISRLSAILVQTGLYADMEVTDLFIKAELSIEKYGAKSMMEASMKMINQKFKPQLFCFCAELVFADGVVTEEEEKLLEYLATAATISEDTAKKIIEVAMIRSGI